MASGDRASPGRMTNCQTHTLFPVSHAWQDTNAEIANAPCTESGGNFRRNYCLVIPDNIREKFDYAATINLRGIMFEGFSEAMVPGDGTEIFLRHAGPRDAPALLLLHGYPQTSAMWHRVAPQLTDDYHVICPDLRGYGRSGKPESDPEHATYSKRSMARDMIKVMDHFEHDRFFAGAHDRGARVAHRLALDFEEHIEAMVLLDIAPTREMYRDTRSNFATAYWHWFFLIQKYPLPEQIIRNDPQGFWKLKCFNQAKGGNPFSDEALSEYLEAFSSNEAIHASCEDYRAAATIDIQHDNEDGNRKLRTPTRVYWAKQGAIESCFDALALWRERAENVDGEVLDATHYMAEEIPKEITSMLRVSATPTMMRRSSAITSKPTAKSTNGHVLSAISSN